ncbi:DUF397 domain-containing protein [Streptomyces sp. BK205]|uniref:DUF397 domain-containing protein n=1 Tax=Streptomyces sp. BK205 TaxID=2512164 RepID=UPI00104DE835|nr:DUF397 domain-containing protein [Streptomyces sp. BK205]
MQTLQWKKSSYSGDSSNCLEIAATPTVIHVRDSKRTDGPHLVLSPGAWTRFICQSTSGSRSHPHPTGQSHVGA